METLAKFVLQKIPLAIAITVKQIWKWIFLNEKSAEILSEGSLLLVKSAFFYEEKCDKLCKKTCLNLYFILYGDVC